MHGPDSNSVRHALPVVALRTFLRGLTRGTVMYVVGNSVDHGVIRLELPVSAVERLSLAGRLSGGSDHCAHKSRGGPLPTSPLPPQVPGTQRGLPAPPGVDTDSGSSRRARRAFQARDYAPHLGSAWAPGRVSSPTEHRRTQAAGVFLLGGGTGAHAGRTGFPDPRHPSVIRLFSSAPLQKPHTKTPWENHTHPNVAF